MNWKTAVSQIERLATAKGRRQTGMYAIEGIRLVERAYRANLTLDFVLIENDEIETPSERLERLLNGLDAAGCAIIPISNDEMNRLTNGRSLGGVLGILPYPEPQPLAQLLTSRPQPLLLTAVDVIDPGNCGAMIRTAHASGCAAFIAVGQTDPFHPKAVRTSMGSLFKMPVLRYESAAALLADLTELEILTVGTAVEGKRPLHGSQFPKQGVALFMGNEYHGLPKAVSQQLDISVTIPMPAGVDSFSVNAATAILLYEINRQTFY